MLNGKQLLVTGGTGSFGQAFVKKILKEYPKISRLVVFSRDELKQYEMAQKFPQDKFPSLRFFIGDVRDQARVKRACEGIDYIVHAAALKQVPVAEYNPTECIRTNIGGAENVINAALDCGVKKVVALSTDKAAAPINLYGATKLCSDKLFIAANNFKGSRDLSFSVVRYGNVLGSRGSVVPHFLKLRGTGDIPVTDERMTRFNITLEQGVGLVMTALEQSWGGELFVPKIPSYRILDVVEAVSPKAKKKIIGIRAGEKLHEEMITESDALNTYDCGNYYVILPANPVWDLNKFCEKFHAKKVPDGFSYNSGKNKEQMTVKELRKQIVQHVDPNFTI